MCGPSPNFHIHVPMSDLYFTTMGFSLKCKNSRLNSFFILHMTSYWLLKFVSAKSKNCSKTIEKIFRTRYDIYWHLPNSKNNSIHHALIPCFNSGGLHLPLDFPQDQARFTWNDNDIQVRLPHGTYGSTGRIMTILKPLECAPPHCYIHI